MNYQQIERVTTDKEQTLFQLVLESRKPTDPLDRILELQIQQIKKKGNIVEIPAEFV